jgi:hypothetical protein
MYKSASFFGTLNERTGYGVHASRFSAALEKLIPMTLNRPGGDVSISLLDVVSASQATTFPPSPSILMTVWESTEYPDQFIQNLKHYDQLWLVSEWEKSCVIAQGIPEEFVKVVPEGVDPDIYKPLESLPQKDTFDFLVVGQFQRRKSTLEIIQSFLKAFPENPKVRLYLSVDTIFPSDPYKSTEERLEAYGISDPRIIVVHFEERAAYVRRLQTADCMVSCSRSEGWNLPSQEGMACGVVSILADWGGSTEYSDGALLVRVPKLEKPEGIYGNWQVPGEWGSPDYGHLVEVMRDAYENYSVHKEKALKTSEMIRTKFSWDAAAQKAFKILEELSGSSSEVNNPVLPDPEEAIRRYARMQGFEITGLKKRSAIFTVDTHPDTKEKMDCLIETLTQIKGLGYPVLVSSHFPLPEKVIEMTDYYLFDKKDILSGEDRPVYWRTDGNKTETVMAGIPCHALAALHNVRNAVDFCLGKYDWIYQMNSDTEPC